jgi:8-oxo-dGTP pyrophosphatase MutT (NUDIX family)
LNQVTLFARIAEAFLPQMSNALNEIKTKIRNLSLNTNEWKRGLGDSEESLASAVLIPLTVKENELAILLTKRSAYLDRHSGQISFPGGVIESGDNTPLDTAFRETNEEIGIQKKQIELLGSLEPFNSKTGFFIYPFIGWIEDLNGLKKSSVEVDKILCIPLSWLNNPDNFTQEDYVGPNGFKKKVWVYTPFEGETVWGITAKIIQDFLYLIKN